MFIKLTHVVWQRHEVSLIGLLLSLVMRIVSTYTKSMLRWTVWWITKKEGRWKTNWKKKQLMLQTQLSKAENFRRIIMMVLMHFPYKNKFLILVFRLFPHTSKRSDRKKRSSIQCLLSEVGRLCVLFVCHPHWISEYPVIVKHFSRKLRTLINNQTEKDKRYA